MRISERALDFVKDGQIVGLGTGRAATDFVHALGERVQGGLQIRGVPTSDRTADLAEELGIPLLSLEEAGELDVAIDGADEVDPQLEMIKGYGGAHVREKIVEACAKKLVHDPTAANTALYLFQRVRSSALSSGCGCASGAAHRRATSQAAARSAGQSWPLLKSQKPAEEVSASVCDGSHG